MEGKIESADEPLVCRFREALIRYGVDVGLKESNQRAELDALPA